MEDMDRDRDGYVAVDEYMWSALEKKANPVS